MKGFMLHIMASIVEVENEIEQDIINSYDKKEISTRELIAELDRESIKVQKADRDY